jgi:hypothetical protein
MKEAALRPPLVAVYRVDFYKLCVLRHRQPIAFSSEVDTGSREENASK